MIVSEASRMFSAISFGVFCRFGPLDQRDHPVDEGLAGLGRDLHDDPVGEHGGAAGHRRPVTAGLADDRGGFTGDRRLVDRRDAFDDVTVAGDDLARLDHDMVAQSELRTRHFVLGQPGLPGLPADQAPGDGLPLGPAQRVGLGLAAALGYRLSQVGEQHGQPQPDDDRPVEYRRPGNSCAGGQHRADLHHEHDRVPDLDPRVQLAEGTGGRLPQHLRVEQPAAHPAWRAALPAGGLGACVRC